MCPRQAAQVEQLKEERRQVVVRAVRGVLARKGFAAVKIVDIAAGAGISHGLVHHYFSGKEALFASAGPRVDGDDQWAGDWQGHEPEWGAASDRAPAANLESVTM